MPYCLTPAGTPSDLCAHSNTNVGQQKKGKKEEEQNNDLNSWDDLRVERIRQRHSRKKDWSFEEGKLSLLKPALLTEIHVRKYGHLPI